MKTTTISNPVSACTGNPERGIQFSQTFFFSLFRRQLSDERTVDGRRKPVPPPWKKKNLTEPTCVGVFLIHQKTVRVWTFYNSEQVENQMELNNQWPLSFKDNNTKRGQFPGEIRVSWELQGVCSKFLRPAHTHASYVRVRMSPPTARVSEGEDPDAFLALESAPGHGPAPSDGRSDEVVYVCIW